MRGLSREDDRGERRGREGGDRAEAAVEAAAPPELAAPGEKRLEAALPPCACSRDLMLPVVVVGPTPLALVPALALPVGDAASREFLLLPRVCCCAGTKELPNA